MDSLGYVFLGVIALASLAQVGVLIAALVRARRMAVEIGARVDRLADELRPQVARLGHVADGLAHVAEGVERRLPGIESALDDASDRMRRTGAAVERVVHRPVGLLAAALVFTVARRFWARRSRQRV